MPIQRCMPSAAGGTSHLLKPRLKGATMRSRRAPDIALQMFHLPWTPKTSSVRRILSVRRPACYPGALRPLMDAARSPALSRHRNNPNADAAAVRCPLPARRFACAALPAPTPGQPALCTSPPVPFPANAPEAMAVPVGRNDFKCLSTEEESSMDKIVLFGPDNLSTNRPRRRCGRA